MRTMKIVRARSNQLLHVETPLGIINILVGLTNHQGQPVDSIMVIPDDRVRRAGLANTRLIGRKNTACMVNQRDTRRSK
ncbi:MAG: hypothetical protein HYZ50_20285 [Deltaproteobacteria bacterium]|nr:hypothetical protein [Deltaproteobacteria bacterium]